MIKVAILVDGAFFIKRLRFLYANQAGFEPYDPVFFARELHALALKHLNWKKRTSRDKNETLYRILYYDCYPLDKRVHNPISMRCIDFSKSREALFRKKFFDELKKMRKVALRLGEIKDHMGWVLNTEKTRDLIRRRIDISELLESDVVYDVSQKGVDMKIGLDIAALAYKKMADKIILISGDSDFVPAAKVARREGIDFVLDPMWNHINDLLFEHIDGLQSTCIKPEKSK